MNIILFFIILLFSYNQAFSCDDLSPDSGYSADNHYYLSGSEASSACAAASSNSCSTNSGGGWSYYYYVTSGVQHYYAYGCSLPPENCLQRPVKVSECGGADKVQCDNQCKCSCIDLCSQQKQSKATECGGIDNVQCDDQCSCSCQSPATCSSVRIQAAQRCGGNDRYIIDQVTCEFACKGECENENLLAAIRCEGQGTYTINTDCSFYCNPSSYCAQEYEALSIRCGGSDQILDFDNSTCTGVCTGCKQEYLAAKNSCSHPLQDPSGGCSFHCGCSQAMQAAESACPNGFRMDTNTCEYQCHDCATLSENCVTQCGGSDNISSFNCSQTTSSQGEVSFQGTPCVCKNDNRCSAFFAECDRICSPANCGGVAVKQCYEAGGQITYSRCDCNGCNSSGTGTGGGSSGGSGGNVQTCADHASACQAACSQEGCGGVKASECSQDTGGSITRTKCECVSCGNKYIGNNNGDGNTPSNPSEPSDSNGWLSAIKQNLDNLVRHAEDEKNWRNSYQSSISDKLNTLIDVNRQGNSAIVTALADVKNAISNSSSNAISIGGSNTQVISNAVEGLGEGLSNVGIETNVGTSGDIDTGNYGSAPVDADLPTAEQSKSAFGVFAPTGGSGGYVGQVKNALSGWRLRLSDETCNYQIPMPRFNYTVNLDFCPYASYFDMVGNLLVCLVALNELLKFS